MSDFTNRTYDEIAIGQSETTTRTLTATDIEALALAAGDVDGYHLDDKNPDDRPSAQAAAAIAMIAGLLNRRLPGPGSSIVGTHFKYSGVCYIGDTLTATVTARVKHKQGHRIEFEALCTNQHGETLVDGVATIAAPTERISYKDLATPQLILRRNDGFGKLMKRCDLLPAVTCAIVHPCDAASLGGAIEAARANLIVPVLIGPEAKIRAVARAEGIDISPYQVVSVEHSHAAAMKAVEMTRAGHVEALMKGSLHTDELMAAVVPSATGLRTARRISHVFVLDVPTYPRLLMVTDAAINIYPDLEVKADICQNAIELAHVLGIAKPKVAVLSAVETINPKIPSTLDAAALCKMADRGQIIGGIIDGPLAFDNAISVEAARTKKIVSAVAGVADILLVPDLEAGNMVAKQLQYLAGADAAGIVLGTRAPIVLTSRADGVRSRLASTAVLKLVAHDRRNRLLTPPA
ncbi:MAG: bifunctional enoyl-CoA hydratase/phosphate acetyltransferase [Betaproteobacteria bacterium]|jgi:phosphate acetyltransferase|nr:bifunctional enoyl-CoA hydratase/phosphate acetyltransferase [Betaproteobacteria bacterium]MBK7080574.1 bifunctional enoyl-CoA hydratase/phosphate acetyltransferase [Betaproteobacteria bacterium]MBK7592325.1 bifunctional enoyl-CoA hydratase/phosphate acetyltransferase [Betaproteobacteria bacterium]MBK8688842.1 bifunctional enoyl-CoA hydratase/phosphate acetyltransferase [Betaproteobacteria bacterium]MBK9674551.1 bifunctional enoyl-CoA hydratase/phosphate acetyltransferase [Betaproteobacteria